MMTYQLFLQTSAVNDLQDAVTWYDAQRPGLGNNFLEELGQILALIEKNPMTFAQVYKDKRRAVLQRFPYNVIYAVEGDLIRVSAIMHGKKDPKNWKRRK